MSDTLLPSGQPFRVEIVLRPTNKAKVKPNHFKKPGDGGNCVGCVLPKTSPHLSPPNDKPETEQESGWDKFVNGATETAKDAAQWYKDNVSQSLHEFGSNAMSTGGNIATVGGGAAAVGGAMVATGVGAAPGAVIAAGGGATAAVGGGVSAVGAGADSAATVLDSAAEAILTGKTPDLIKPAIALGQRLLINLLLKKVPGVGGTSKITTQANGKSGGHLKGCKHLEKGPPGAKYQGGSHRKVKDDSKRLSRESHHIPPKSTSPHHELDGPAISMDYADHRGLNSTGRLSTHPASIAQKQMAHSGPAGFLGAMMIEINEIRQNHGNKYDAAITWMLLYAACMGYIPSPGK